VYSAVHTLAVAAAGQPVVVASVKGAEVEPGEEERRAPARMKHFLEQKMPPRMRMKAANQELEVQVQHPLLDLLDRPNSVQDRWQFVYSFIANLNLTGWAYIVGGENSEGQMELWSLPTSWVIPSHKEGPFSSFKIVNPKDPARAANAPVLGRENVTFAYLPDPGNPLSALAPATAQLNALRIDDHIQTSQERFFEMGVFPSVVITVGKDPHPDVPSGIRPRLSPAQRRQVMGAISRQWQGVHNYGAPAVVDGLIERIDRWSATANEMGWDKSEDKIKTRILSAYAVHPLLMGEPISVGGYAQAAVIKQIFCDRVNSFLGMLSVMMSNFAGPMVQQGELLKVWWEMCEPRDPQLESQNWREARKNGDVTRNEFRARLGLPPDETAVENRSALLSTVGGMTGAVQILTAMGNGFITPDTAAGLLALFFEIDEAEAKRLVGSGDARTAGQAVEVLEEAVRQLKEPVEVRLDDTGMDKKLAELMGAIEQANAKANTAMVKARRNAKSEDVQRAVAASQKDLAGKMEKAVTEMELAIRKKQGDDDHAGAIKKILSDLGESIGAGLETVQKQAEQPVTVTVTNEVQTPEVNVQNEVQTPEIKITNEVPVPSVEVNNDVPVPEVNVDVAAPEVKVNNDVPVPDVTVNVAAPEVKVEGSKVEVPPIEVPAAEVTVNVARDECPTEAVIIHPGGRESHVRLLKDEDKK
jgi:hypothetical protein